MITKHTFEAVAKVIAESAASPNMNGEEFGGYSQVWASGYDSACERIANKLADHFQSDNPNFNRARFLEACKVVDLS